MHDGLGIPGATRLKEVVLMFIDQPLFEEVVDLIDAGNLALLGGMIAADSRLVGVSDGPGGSVMRYAVYRGDLACVTLLLDMGADVEAIDGGPPYLHEALDSLDDGDLAMARLLLNRGADIEARGFNYWTALHRAAVNGKAEFARLLIAAGANVNARSRIDGEETPLMLAAFAGQKELCKLLVGAGADSTLVDTRGQTAREIGSHWGNPDVLDAGEAPAPPSA
jgi:ankyrin repeat protein